MSHLIHLDHTQSIFTILLFDPASTVRLAVSNLLITILDGSKQFLSVAIERLDFTLVQHSNLRMSQKLTIF
jgi:hypothetical protein